MGYNQRWLEEVYMRSSMCSLENPVTKVAETLEQLAHTADGVFAVDRHHRIILWNQAAEFLLGYTAQEVLGRLCEDVIRGCNCNGQLTCVKKCSHFEEARKLRWQPHQKVCTRSKDGTDVWIDMSTLSILSKQRNLSTLVHIFRNAGAVDADKDNAQLPQLVSSRTFRPWPGRSKDEEDDGNRKPLHLTMQELSVLRHLANGKSTKAISEILFISPTTVKNHVQHILRKMQVHSRLEAIMLAYQELYMECDRMRVPVSREMRHAPNELHSKCN